MRPETTWRYTRPTAGLWIAAHCHSSRLLALALENDISGNLETLTKRIVLYFRGLLGVILKEWIPYRRLLGESNSSYLRLCNRNERLEVSPDGRGYRCDWRWTSDLHAPKYLPVLGLRLMKRALSAHPIRRTALRASTNAPDVSFIVGHRGLNRLPQLLATLESIAGQEGASVECLVVEQDTDPHLAGRLPSWVRHIHTPPPSNDLPYCRSWTFNIGAKQARGSVLVLHDNDMLVPSDYAASILEQVRQGFQVVNLKRFIFYLNEQHTNSVLDGKAEVTDKAPLSIVQNLEAGGSVAITRQAFEQIGGMDELFIGWGGEDNEFWERAQTLNVWPYAWLPLVHLWHLSQPEKLLANPEGQKLFHTLSDAPVEARIAALRASPQGMIEGPFMAAVKDA